MARTKSNEVAIPGADFTTEELASITDFSAALEFLKGKIGEENVKVASEEIGDGFKLLENKDQLCGVQFLIVNWDFHQGDHGEFVSCKVITQDNLKYIVNDGSSGIRDQLMAYTAKQNIKAGLFCKKGLRRSDYKYTDENGQEKPATTYYLDTSA